MPSKFQRMTERDLSVQHLGYRAVCLCVGRDAIELFGADAGHLGLQLKRGPGDGEAVTILVDRHLGRRVEDAILVPRRGQRETERHGEAAGMGGSDQFLRIGAGFVAKARAEAVALILEDAGLGRDGALPVLPQTLIARGTVACRHVSFSS